MSNESKGTILVAVADERLGGEFQERISSTGQECPSVATAEEVKEMLREREVDVLVCQVGLPGSVGLELVEWLDERALGVSVILYASEPDLSSAIRSVELPVVAYLPGPVVPQFLADRVAREMRRRASYKRLLEREAEIARCLVELRKECDEKEKLIEAAGLKELDRLCGRVENLFSALREAPETKAGAALPPKEFRYRKIESALEHAVEVLDSTRGQFKSRELGRLRRFLEGILENDRRAGQS